nr:lipoprotein [Borreliella japonica]WKC87661.1 lipoprotein [Borreliella japonica]
MKKFNLIIVALFVALLTSCNFELTEKNRRNKDST